MTSGRATASDVAEKKKLPIKNQASAIPRRSGARASISLPRASQASGRERCMLSLYSSARTAASPLRT